VVANGCGPSLNVADHHGKAQGERRDPRPFESPSSISRLTNEMLAASNGVGRMRVRTEPYVDSTFHGMFITIE